MAMEIYVVATRTGHTVATGTVQKIENNYSRGGVRLLRVLLDKGYEIKLYASLAEIQALKGSLATFPVGVPARALDLEPMPPYDACSPLHRHGTEIP